MFMEYYFREYIYKIFYRSSETMPSFTVKFVLVNLAGTRNSMKLMKTKIFGFVLDDVQNDFSRIFLKIFRRLNG